MEIPIGLFQVVQIFDRHELHDQDITEWHLADLGLAAVVAMVVIIKSVL